MNWRLIVFLGLAATMAYGEARLGDVDAFAPVSSVVREGLATPVENVFVGKDAGARSSGLTNVVVVGRDSGQDATGLENVFALGDNTLRSDSSLRNCLFVGDGIGTDEMSGVTNCLMVMGRDWDYGVLDAGTSGLVRFFGAFDVWESGIWHIGRNAAWLEGVPGGDVDSATLQFGVDNGGSLHYDVSPNTSTLRVGYGASVGDNGIAVGYKAKATASGVSVGYKAKGEAAGDVAIGLSAHARGEVENPNGVGAVAIGGNATAVSGSENSGGSTAIGFNAAAGETCLAIGNNATAGSTKWKLNTNKYATAIGPDAKATHAGSTVVGSYWSDAIGESDVKSQGPLTFNVAAPDPAYFYFGAASRDADGEVITPRSLDWYLRWSGTFDIAMGPDAITTTNSVVIGGEAWAGGPASVAVGSWSTNDGGAYCVSVGASAVCSTTRDGAGHGTAVGFASEAYGNSATALGASAHADSHGTAVGAEAKAYGNSATALGASAYAEATNVSAIGTAAYAGATNASAIGTFAYAGIADSLAFPTDAEHTYFNSVVSNKGATAVSLRTYLDAKADATNVYSRSEIDGKGYLTDENDPVFAAWTNGTSVVLGNAAKKGPTNGTAVGGHATAGTVNSTAVGAFSKAGYCSSAFGYGATADNGYSLALGYDSYAPNTSSMGLTFTPSNIYLGAKKPDTAGRTLQSYLDARATTNALAEVNAYITAVSNTLATAVANAAPADYANVSNKAVGAVQPADLAGYATTNALAAVEAKIPTISATDATFSNAVNVAARALVKSKLESLDKEKSSIGDMIGALQSIYESETK